MRTFYTIAVLSVFLAIEARAVPITNFDGIDVTATFIITDNNGQPQIPNPPLPSIGGALFGGVVSPSGSPSVATIGSGPEFKIQIGAWGKPTMSLDLDIEAGGVAWLYSDKPADQGNFDALGSSFWDSWSFEITLSFPDPLISFTSVSTFGNPGRGTSSVFGPNPTVWHFDSQFDNSFGHIVTMNNGWYVNNNSECVRRTASCPLPGLQFTADRGSISPPPNPSAIPAPDTLPLLLTGLVSLAWARRRPRRNALA